MLDKHNTYGMPGDFDPPAASEIHLNLDRYHGADKATRQGLLLNFWFAVMIQLYGQPPLRAHIFY